MAPRQEGFINEFGEVISKKYKDPIQDIKSKIDNDTIQDIRPKVEQYESARWPDCSIGQLIGKMDGKEYFGIGALIGPNIVLTCAH